MDSLIYSFSLQKKAYNEVTRYVAFSRCQCLELCAAFSDAVWKKGNVMTIQSL